MWMSIMSKWSSKQIIIDVSGLAKSFNGINAVVNLNLQIEEGTIFGFLGPNGSGKTTSLRLLSGLIIPDKGQGRCLNLDLMTQTKLIQAQIGYMPQNFCLYQNLTVYENLDFIARIYQLKNRKERLKEIIELLALSDNQKRITATLSGGWKQRVALAAALLHKPRILLLDEPTSGIDPQSRLLIWAHIQSIVSKGVTVLLSTQHMDEAERCHQLVYMSAGEIIARGSVIEIIQSTGLHSWVVKGESFSRLKDILVNNPAIQMIEKGNEMRISSIVDDIHQVLDPFVLNNYEIKKTDTTLEDAFIYKIMKEGNPK
ncbi:TPA: ABC transporter ATP-binding protein [Legionella pneumophila]|uniref:ABC transporter ATP-binding protein n=2 Tax=Legionella pneumophila TaxID=446 RepID=A0AAN5PHI1_LEGPN|nr:ABC transporter ATP-binding protein [Legionella pneumophila subsp. pneumophila ATCC 43290]PPK34612.1 ABC transporter ATP-binding protein [Legionella pneumophila]HAT8683724.1 ATP-binding cassette domain-containing protein [Legionella pneumophila subsp. pneumophila ATCC 43283]HAT8826259.1 ATP-binding cassette domain-containing protein [Legionella pneumophila subsp. pneumophila]OOD08032.1 multidrug ABC transporter ATP-binding protein [Legionella pneumophila subsp. pneumophila ATCC 43290]